MPSGYAISLTKSLQDVDTLRGQLEKSTFWGELRRWFAVDRLDEAGVHKPLAH